MSEVAAILDAYARYATRFTKGNLPAPSGRRRTVLTYMDARLDPAKAPGSEERDVRVLRNAAGRASDGRLPAVRQP